MSNETSLALALLERERAAKIIEENIILYGGAERWALKPRLDGNTDGLHYAAAIRAQPPLDVAGMVEEAAERVRGEMLDPDHDEALRLARAALGIPAQGEGGDERH